MNKKSLRVFLSFPIFALVAQTSALAGVVFQIETTTFGPKGESTMSSEMKVEGSDLKMGISSAAPGGKKSESGEMIFRGDVREMTAIDHNRKSYFVVDEESLKMMAARFGQMQNQFGMSPEMMKNLPPAARKKLEEMQASGVNIPGMSPPPGATPPAKPQPEFRKTSERGEMAGYPCVKFEKYVEGDMTQELWVTDWDNIDGADDLAQAFESMAGFFAEMKEAFGGRGGPGLGDENSPFLALKALDGFPVVTREFEDGELERESMLRSAEKIKFDSDEFGPPADYKRQSMGPG
jgi:hypothetical protein